MSDAPSTGARALILGLDGATWAVAQQLIEDGGVEAAAV